MSLLDEILNKIASAPYMATQPEFAADPWSPRVDGQRPASLGALSVIPADETLVSPFGNARFGGNTYGGNRYGGNTYGGAQYGASADPWNTRAESSTETAPFTRVVKVAAAGATPATVGGPEAKTAVPADDATARLAASPLYAPFSLGGVGPQQATASAGQWNTRVEDTPSAPERVASAAPAAPSRAPQQASMAASIPGLSSVGEFLSALGKGYSSGGLLGGIGDALQTVDSASAPRNLTITALQQKGLTPEQAMTVARSPELLKAVMPKLFVDRTAAHRPAEYSKTPFWGVDKDGNAIPLQVGTDGTIARPQIPEGVTISGKPITVDTATGTILIDPITRQPVGAFQKDIAGAASAKEQGEAQGKAAANLPQAVSNAQSALKLVDETINHPGRTWGTGVPFYFSGLPSTGSRDFNNRVDQLKGTTFLQAFQMLRGGGAITEIEGQKAENAIARLKDQAVSEADYLTALKDLREILAKGIGEAQRRAIAQPILPGGGAATPQYVTPPAAARTLAVGSAFSDDQLADLPDGAVIRDETGRRYRIQDGKAVPVQ